MTQLQTTHHFHLTTTHFDESLHVATRAVVLFDAKSRGANQSLGFVVVPFRRIIRR